MIITHKLIESAKTPAGAWTRAQLAVLGIQWPPKQGWKKNLVGAEISDETYQRFLEARSIRAPKRTDFSCRPKESSGHPVPEFGPTTVTVRKPGNGADCPF